VAGVVGITVSVTQMILL